MNPQPTPTLHDLLTRFTMCAYHGDAFPSQTIQVATLQELKSAASDMLETQKAFWDNNKEVKFGGAEGKYVQLSYDGYILRVTLEKPTKRAQNVKPTSIEAYHTIDFTTQRDRIAEIIRQHHQGITRKEIEVFHGFGSNAVTGRVKELLEMSEEKPFRLGGGLYRLEVVGTRLSLCKGASKVPNEVLQWMPVKQPADAGAQIEMFT